VGTGIGRFARPHFQANETLVSGNEDGVGPERTENPLKIAAFADWRLTNSKRFSALASS